MSKLKGVWVDGGIWECKELSLQEKHFFQKIKDLDNENGCFANNAFFADFFSVSKGRCTQVIDKLVEKKFVSKKLEKKGVLVTRRVLRILNRGVQLSKHGGVKDSKLGVKYSKQEEFKILKDSNTLKLNNRIKNLEEREKSSLSQIEFLESKVKNLASKLALQTEKKKGKESSEKESKNGQHVFPDTTAQKTYKVETPKSETEIESSKDKRQNKQLPFTTVSAKKTLDALFPTNEDLEKMYNSVFSEKATTEIISDSRVSFVEKGITNYYPTIKTIDLLQGKLLAWIKKEVKFQRNKIDKPSKISQNEDGTPSYMMGLQ